MGGEGGSSRAPAVGFCTLCGTQVPRSKADMSLPGAFLCPTCAAQASPPEAAETAERPRGGRRGRRAADVVADGPRGEALEGMIRKNLTITEAEDKFLQLHQEINQSALFRRAISTLMEAENGPRPRSRKRQE